MKIKSLLASILLFAVVHICFGQENFEKYCEVTTVRGRIEVNLGYPNLYFKDSTVKNRLLAVKNFDNDVDVLDYMSKIGWTLVSITPVGQFNSFRVFYFKKTFNKSEFMIDPK